MLVGRSAKSGSGQEELTFESPVSHPLTDHLPLVWPQPTPSGATVKAITRHAYIH